MLQNCTRFDDANDPVGEPLLVVLYLDNVPISLKLYVSTVQKEIRVLLRNDNRAILKSISQIQLRKIDHTLSIADYTQLQQPGIRFLTAAAQVLTDRYSLTINEQTYTAIFANTQTATLFAAMNALRDQINAVHDGLAFVSTLPTPTPTLELRFWSNPTAYKNIVVKPDNLEGLVFDYIRPISEWRAMGVKAFFENPQNLNRADYVFPQIHAPLFYSKDGSFLNNYGFNRVLNRIENGTFFENGAYVADPTIGSTKNWANAVCPLPRLAFIIRKIAEKVNLEVTGEMIDNADLFAAALYYPLSIDELQQDLQSDLDIKFRNVVAESIRFADHVPDQKAEEFINDVCEQFGLYYAVENAKLVFKSLRKYLQIPPRDFTQKIIVDTITYNRAERQGLTLSRREDDSERSYGSYPQQLNQRVVGKGKQSYTPPFGTLNMTTFFNKFMPTTEQTGNSKSAEIENRDAQYRLLLYRGVTSQQLFAYPFATHGKFNQVGVSVGNLSLAFTGDGNVYDQLLRGVLELKEGEEFEFEAKIEAIDFYDFVAEKYSRITIATPEGTIHAAVKEMRLSEKNERRDCTITAVRITQL